MCEQNRNRQQIIVFLGNQQLNTSQLIEDGNG